MRNVLYLLGANPKWTPPQSEAVVAKGSSDGTLPKKELNTPYFRKRTLSLKNWEEGLQIYSVWYFKIVFKKDYTGVLSLCLSVRLHALSSTISTHLK